MKFLSILLFASVVSLTALNTYASNSLHELSLEDKQVLLDAHNTLRTQCATGQDGSRNGPTMAAKMNKVYWDPALEEMAKKRAKACYFGHLGGPQAIRDAYDDVRHMTSYNSEGSARSQYATENVSLFVQNPPASQYSNQMWANGVQAWFNEAKSFNWSDNECTADTCGHWSQMCYDDTRYIGCAVANCDDGITGAPDHGYGDGGMQLVCTYWPTRDLSKLPYRQTYDDWPICLGCSQTDSEVCQDNLCAGGKNTDFLSSGMKRTWPNQCEDGLGREEVLCDRDDDTQAPGPVNNLEYSLINGSINLLWDKAEDDTGITYYQVVRVHNGKEKKYQILGSKTRFIDTDTPSQGTIRYTITPNDYNHNRGPEVFILANTSGGTVTDVTPPTKPTHVIANSLDQNVTLFWLPSTDDYAVDHYLLIDEQGNETRTPHLLLEIGELQVKTHYYFNLHAVDTSGNTSAGHRVYLYHSTRNNEDTQPPLAPTNFVTNAANTEITLSWQAPLEIEVGMRYYLYRDGLLVANTRELSFVDTQPIANKVHLYQLLSIDASGNKSDMLDITASI